MGSGNRKEREDSVLGNYWYLFRGWFGNSRWNLFFVLAELICSVSEYFVGLYLPKVGVSLVVEQVSVEKLTVTLGLMGLLYFVLKAASHTSYQLINNPCLKYRHVLEERVLQKICHTSYSDLEDPDYKKMIDRAQQLYVHWDRDVKACVYETLNFVFYLIMIPIASGLLAVLHPAAVLVLAAGAWVQYRLGRRTVSWEKKHRDFWQPLEMKIDYIVSRIKDFAYAKDLRLYGAEGWLMPKYGGLLKERRKWKRRQMRQEVANYEASRVAGVGKEVIVYGFLLHGVLEGRVGPDDFVLYVGLMRTLSASLSQIARKAGKIKENVLSIADYRKIMSMPDSMKREPGPGPEVPVDGEPAITFSHVCFAYPGADEEILKDIDIKICPGEKIALVGPNGAGKTTLIKLLCGMYEPTRGEILVNGIPSVRWDLESWYKLFSVVFQDIGVIPATIAENVAACPPEEMDRNKVRACLEQAGLLDLAESLPEGLDTCLPKEMFREGVNLSGGETQKLLLARAIYKEAPILVLDEPTAALDSKAENQLYLKYNELTRGRTSVFISHRLSSTRFCDRILMMENGRIVEEGSHEELMEKKGIYYRLFQVQSHYYRNDRTEEFSTGLDPEWEVSGYVSR